MNLRTLYVLSFNDRNVTAAAVILEVTLLKPWSPSDHDKPEVYNLSIPKKVAV